MSNLLFDTPIWILGALAVVGGSLFVAGNNRTDAKMRLVGVLVVVAGLVMFLTSWLVDTDEEKAVNHSKNLVAAVGARDWDKVANYLDPRCKLVVFGTPFGYRSKSEILDACKLGVEQRYDIQHATVTHSEARSNVDFISVDITVKSEQGAGIGYPMTTDWQLDWQDTNDGWKVKEITAKRVGNQSGDQIRRMFPRVDLPFGWPGGGGPGGGGQSR